MRSRTAIVVLEGVKVIAIILLWFAPYSVGHAEGVYGCGTPLTRMLWSRTEYGDAIQTAPFGEKLPGGGVDPEVDSFCAREANIRFIVGGAILIVAIPFMKKLTKSKRPQAFVPRSSGVKRLRVALGLLAASLIVFLMACSGEATHDVFPDASKVPYTAGVMIGKAYPYSLLIHCGIRHVVIDGRWWKATEGRVGDENNLPDGGRYLEGSVRLLGESEAEFRSGKRRVRFSPIPEASVIPCR